jgi:hypothetical protein
MPGQALSLPPARAFTHAVRGAAGTSAKGGVVPFESRLFVKTGIICLVLTFAAGAALLVLTSSGITVPAIIEVEHGHLGFVGWLVNSVHAAVMFESVPHCENGTSRTSACQ